MKPALDVAPIGCSSRTRYLASIDRCAAVVAEGLASDTHGFIAACELAEAFLFHPDTSRRVKPVTAANYIEGLIALGANRVTTTLAERNGTTAHGVEIGPLGTFTLRVVRPWYDPRTRRLIGYVELGMETPEVVERIGKSLDAEAFVLIGKEFLDRADWENGMRVFGRTPDWGRFSEVVVNSQTLPSIPPTLAHRIENGEMETAPDESSIQFGGRFYRPLFIPIHDVGGRNVATIALLVDVSDEINSARLALFLGGTAYLVGGVLLFVLFYHLVGWIGRRIEENELKLQELAAIDKLTGLLNSRIYHASLKREILRAQREGDPVSILVLDVDHFKKVNDTYGHVAGDKILEKLGHLLKEYTRGGSGLFRYGGEEFAVLLPGLGMDGAMETANRLRIVVEQANFDIGDDRKIKVTVSIGVAVFPDSAATPEELTKAADAALYVAKETGRNRVSQYGNLSSKAAESLASMRIPEHPPTHSDNMRPPVPGYPPTSDALP